MRNARRIKREAALDQKRSVIIDAELAYAEALLALYPSNEFKVGDKAYQEYSPSRIGVITEFNHGSRRWWVRWPDLKSDRYYADELVLAEKETE